MSYRVTTTQVNSEQIILEENRKSLSEFLKQTYQKTFEMGNIHQLCQSSIFKLDLWAILLKLQVIMSSEKKLKKNNNNR